MDTETKFAAIRVYVAVRRPYFATALFALHLVAEPRAETMAIDKHGRVYINPARIGGEKPKKGEWSIAQAGWVLVHELGHWLRSHHSRALPHIANAPLADVEAHREAINLCEDAEINDDLAAEADVNLPARHITPETLGFPPGLLWEEYYEAMKKKGHATRPSGDSHDCGSGAHGVRREYELPEPGDNSPGLSETETDLIRQQVAAEIQRTESQTPGTVAVGWRRWAGAILKPSVVPWERELSALVKNACTMACGMYDYSYTRPSRRGTFMGVIQPEMVRPEPEAAVVIDTSASMNEDLLASALREVQGILRAVGQRKIPVICCDVAVHGGVQRVSSAFQVELDGGGGTDMGVGIDAAQRLRSNVIIVLTDGFTPWPDKAPVGCQLVIGIIEGSPPLGAYPPPSYATRVLHIRAEKRAA